MGVLFDTFPPVLQLHLKRFDYDYDRDMQIKARCSAAPPCVGFTHRLASVVHFPGMQPLHARALIRDAPGHYRRHFALPETPALYLSARPATHISEP